MRFGFGRNWRDYVHRVNDEDIAAAMESVASLVGDVRGRSFLDVGCGSGLFSLAAHRLGADVRSFDYDADSVAATEALQERTGTNWPVQQADILDPAFRARLGEYDIVYSWGVLHHTGSMWRGCSAAASLVAPGGRLAVSLYNDQGVQSWIWRGVKWAYNVSPILRPLMLTFTFLVTWGAKCLMAVRRGTTPWAEWKGYRRERGMSPWHDVVDWAGGYPFEVAQPREVVEFFTRLGLEPVDQRLVGNRMGCNEFVFERPAIHAATGGSNAAPSASR